MNAKPAGSGTKAENYTALIYFHGMGEQRRYEEVSRLIDALDSYDFQFGDRHLSGIHFKSERPRSALPRDVGYVEATYFNAQVTKRKKFRFYEAYYANLAAGGMRPLSVLWWMIQLALMPIWVLLTPWRARMRLRRATLLGIWDRWNKASDQNENDLKRLLKSYDDFEGPDARRSYPKGRFRDYVRFLRKENARNPEQSKRLVRLARRWRRRFVAVQLWILFYIATFGLTLSLLGTRLIAPAILPLLNGANPNPFQFGLMLVVIGVIVYLASIFLRSFMGDVYFWTTYQETAEKSQTRRAILNYCAEFVSHVLCDERCERVVLVGHSLGTTVIHDTILEMAFRNRSASPDNSAWGPIPLDRIQHLFTLASPVDKIHYLFESSISGSHRFNRVIEELRGDIGSFPFSTEGRPLIHWINFWNRADVISSRLYTPMNYRFDEVLVDNHEVALDFFPEPVSAHTDYFKNKTVVETIYCALFQNACNFVTHFKNFKKSHRSGSPKFADLLIGHQGAGERLNTAFQVLVILLPWLKLLDLTLETRNVGLFRETSLLLFQADVAIILSGVLLIFLFRWLKWTYVTQLT